jgi:hypothetical protein
MRETGAFTCSFEFAVVCRQYTNKKVRRNDIIFFREAIDYSRIASAEFEGQLNAIFQRKVLRRRHIYSPRLYGVWRAASIVKPRLFAVFQQAASI